MIFETISSINYANTEIIILKKGGYKYKFNHKPQQPKSKLSRARMSHGPTCPTTPESLPILTASSYES